MKIKESKMPKTKKRKRLKVAKKVSYVITYMYEKTTTVFLTSLSAYPNEKVAEKVLKKCFGGYNCQPHNAQIHKIERK